MLRRNTTDMERRSMKMVHCLALAAAALFAGVVAVVVIALVIDLLLVLAGRLLMPWTRRVKTPARRATRTAVTA
jgi:Flp pilus assembly protein TadB